MGPTPVPPAGPKGAERGLPRASLEARPDDSALTTDALLALGIFDAPESRRRLAATLARSPGAVVLRHYRAGEIVLREGEPGSSAFYILTAAERERVFRSRLEARARDDPALAARLEALSALDRPEALLAAAEAAGPERDLADWARAAAEARDPVASQAPAAEVFLLHARRPPRARWGGAVVDSLLGRRPGFDPGARAYIPNDGPVDLRQERPIASMGPGDVFGEMACMTNAPRSATVRAVRDCRVLEMLRNVFEELQRSPRFRARIEEDYRRRALGPHLADLPLFRRVGPELLAHIAGEARLERRAGGEVIFRQGDPSDAMYVVRMGIVAVRQREGEVERVIAYLARGDALGEMGLVRGEPRNATCVAYRHSDAGEESQGYVDLVRIDAALFAEIRARSPEFDRTVRELAAKRLEQNRSRRAPTPLPHVAELGLLEGQRLMLIDERRCTRCDACVEACADTHDGRARLIRDGPRFGHMLVPTTCRQCLDPVCMIGCPVGSIRRGELGEVRIESWCIGCGKCAESCPYDAIAMHDRDPEEMAVSSAAERLALQEPAVAVVCDQCAELGGVPRCVYACPHEAAIRVDALDFFLREDRAAAPGPAC
jgi:CRP-like cAMP-binding protein/Fe-S-cluster-containing hydrogenase component 2